ncbi:MAG TPA: hypothetical protein VF074_18580 [Pyrinomonadaceae bacterium]
MQKLLEPGAEKIRDYLLGNLTDDQKVEVEGKILNDDLFFEELLVSENELVDDYFAGRLTEAEKQQFENHFLIAPERKAKFRFGRVFSQYLELHDTTARTSEESGVRSHSFLSRLTAAIGNPGAGLYRPLPRTVVVISLVVILLVGCVTYWWWSQRVRNFESGQQVASVSLMPGTLRSGGATQKVEITPDVGRLELELRLASVYFPSYQAELMNEGATVSVVDGLKAITRNGQHSVVLTTKPLGRGDYQVKLSGASTSGQLQPLNTYSFRVVAP